MCGIAGAVNFAAADRGSDGRARCATRSAIADPTTRRRAGVAAASGSPARRRVGLGNRRLSIIDVAGGHQPIANEDETVWTVFNGEIYNFQALRARARGRAAIASATSS